MKNNMSLSDKYKREVKRNKHLTTQHAKLLVKLQAKDKLAVERDRLIGEQNLEILELKQKIYEINVFRH